jgi:FKBP-type peptidyl-prolyl cis-trans isomerase
MSLAVAGEPSPSEMEKIGPSIQEMISKRLSAALTKIRNENLAEAATFLTEVRTKPGVVSLDDGLAYEVVKDGDGPIPTPEQYVKVNYVGRLINGTEFDRSEEGKPVEFKLNGVIPGWTEALSKIKQGSRVTLYIPPHLAYGDQGAGEIPPGATLIFDVELVGVSDKPTMPVEADHAEEAPAADANH